MKFSVGAEEEMRVFVNNLTRYLDSPSFAAQAATTRFCVDTSEERMALRGVAVRVGGAGGVVLVRRGAGFAGLVADSGAGDVEVREEEPCRRCHSHFIE